MERWPRNYRHKAAAVVFVEPAALGGVADVRVAREDTGALRHHAVVPCRVLHHVRRQKTNATAIDAIIYTDGCECRFLLPLHQNLHLTEAHNDILCHHLSAVEALLCGFPITQLIM